MQVAMKNFLVRLLVVAAVMAVLSLLVFSRLPDTWTTPAWPYLLLFFVASNLILYTLYAKAQAKKLSKFANFFMLATFLKLVVYLAIIVVYLLFYRDDVVPFVLTFFIYYVVFTALEVMSVSKSAK